MKVTIHETGWTDSGGDHVTWSWSGWIGGLPIASCRYTTRRACVRGLGRWFQRAQGETVAGFAGCWSTACWEEVERAIRESRGGK
jgi:hypothetical protein